MLKRLVSAALFAALLSFNSAAEEYPARHITIVVPSPAGGLSDILARIVADKAAPLLRATMIVENKPGAAGALGGAFVARALPDGYTILLANGASHGALPAMKKKPPYDPINDYVPIAHVGETQLALVAAKKLPVTNAQELLAYARKHPGKLNYASFGHGSAGHLFGEVLKKENDVDMVHVPYRGEAAVLQALLAQELDLAIVVSAKPLVDDGKVQLIGITSPESAEAYPGWPTLAAQGVKGFSRARGFQAFLAPAGTPQPIVDKLATAFAQVLGEPEVRKRLLELGVSPPNERPDKFPALYRSLVSQWADIVQASGVHWD